MADITYAEVKTALGYLGLTTSASFKSSQITEAVNAAKDTSTYKALQRVDAQIYYINYLQSLPDDTARNMFYPGDNTTMGVASGLIDYDTMLKNRLATLFTLRDRIENSLRKQGKVGGSINVYQTELG